MRKVLSFDVGIVHLAYCILEIDDEKQLFNIVKWDIINLANNRKLCEYTGNKKCMSIAKTFININGKKYYCKAHIKKSYDNIDIIKQEHKILSVTDTKKCSYCKYNSNFFINDLYFCSTHQKKALTLSNLKCMSNKCVNVITNKIDDTCGWCDEHFETDYNMYLAKQTKKMAQNSNKISLTFLCSSMYEQLDAIPELLQVDEILIENQPTLLNPTMKTVSAMLFSYFMIRGIHDKAKTHSIIKTVNFCSPSNKIKVGGDEATKQIKNTNKVYSVTKKLSKVFCKSLINEQWLKIITSHKKQDDLADAFLQGFIMNFPILPEHYANKIKDLFIETV